MCLCQTELDCNHNNFRPWLTMTCLLWVDINPFLKEMKNWRPKEEEEGGEGRWRKAKIRFESRSQSTTREREQQTKTKTTGKTKTKTKSMEEQQVERGSDWEPWSWWWRKEAEGEMTEQDKICTQPRIRPQFSHWDNMAESMTCLYACEHKGT